MSTTITMWGFIAVLIALIVQLIANTDLNIRLNKLQRRVEALEKGQQ